ncbi:hypothetical protein AVEN_258182-1 [Araneus ventricosus]|uniref:Uncharacterized protein n=1 Tax=Araneus ventricosus TaxID=182803 RepID=A0A4Y2I4P9_ARAVE|nr:hypothetical protein AVEN_116656-1 [Araneus ventricosus]GBO46680.1 hypothetical protein AVEN_258182-1 [Araneus ventricosus]
MVTYIEMTVLVQLFVCKVTQEDCVSDGNRGLPIIPVISIKDTGVVGDFFILQDDNANPHITLLVENCLCEKTIERMARSARSPDLDPIEYDWNSLGRRITVRYPPPAILQGLRIALTQEWAWLPNESINTIILGWHIAVLAV